MEEEKTCENCRHFRRYYIKQRLRFSPREFGECRVPNLKDRKKVHFPYERNCPRWQTNEEEEALRRELARRAFGNVNERIDELISLLKR